MSRASLWRRVARRVGAGVVPPTLAARSATLRSNITRSRKKSPAQQKWFGFRAERASLIQRPPAPAHSIRHTATPQHRTMVPDQASLLTASGSPSPTCAPPSTSASDSAAFALPTAENNRLRWAGLLSLVLIASLVALVAATQRSARARHVDVLFVLRDAGETLSLLPVMLALARSPNNLTVTALIWGAARDVTAPGGNGNVPVPLPRGASFLTWKDVGATTMPSDAARDPRLPDADVDRLLASVRPRVVVTGMVSAVQLQVALAYRRGGGSGARDASGGTGGRGRGRRGSGIGGSGGSGSGGSGSVRGSGSGGGSNGDSSAATDATTDAVVGLDDGFGLWNSSNWDGRFVAHNAITHLFTTAEVVAVGARAQAAAVAAKAGKSGSTLNVSAVGSPTLESWQEAVRDRRALESLRSRLFPGSDRGSSGSGGSDGGGGGGGGGGSPIVSFMGGYGDGYLDSVRIFAKGIAALQQQKVSKVSNLSKGAASRTGTAESKVRSDEYEST